MTARDVLRTLQHQGVSITLQRPERLHVAPLEALSSTLRQAIREQHAEFLTLLEAFAERVAIVE